MPPINDEIVNAVDLGTDPDNINISGTNIAATWDADETANFYDQPSVWYKFVLTTTTTLNFTITKTGSDPDWEPYAEIYEDVVPGTPNFDQLLDEYREYVGDTSHTSTESVFQGPFPAGTYYVSVTNWNFDGSTDTFDFELNAAAPPPVNDAYNNRIHLDSKYAVSQPGTTEGATFAPFGEEPNVDPTGDNDPNPTVWYEWEAPNYNNEPLDVSIEAVGSGDYYVELITGNPFGFTVVDTAHNAPLIVTGVDGFDDLKIRVASPVSGWGDFDLQIDVIPGGSPPANDDWASAEVLSGYTDSASGTTVGATGQYAEVLDDDYSFEQTNTVWYKYSPPQTGRMVVWLETPSDDITMFVWRGPTLEDLVVIKDVSMFVGGYEDFTSFSVETGHDYYFQIMGDGGNETTFDISIELSSASAPANDDPANATLLTTNGTITTTNDGANWDATGPFAGHFVDEAWENVTTWYKYVPTEDGSIVITFNDETHHSTFNAADRSFLVVLWGADLSTALQMLSVAEPDHPTQPFTGEVAVEAGETYWFALESFVWSDAIDIDYEFFSESDEGPFEPIGDGTFDSTTGFFVWDDEDQEYVASGSVGYGTIEPWPDGHYPYGWWTRFYLRSSSGEFLYRFGQSEQVIEAFRATYDDAQYHSLLIIGHRNGTQTIGVGVNGALVYDSDYKVWGENEQSTTGRVRIELGRNGVTIDGRCHIPAGYFQDSTANQCVSFDYGIRSYPTDGTATVDLDPEWDMRYSAIVLHDDPERGVVGQLDPEFPEVTAIHGWTSGVLINETNNISWKYISQNKLPTVVASSGDYDGFSLDCSDTTPTIYGCGAQWTPSYNTIWHNPFTDPPMDTNYPGLSFRFWVSNFPSEALTIAAIYGGTTGDSTLNGSFLSLGTDGTLYIKPSYNSDPIPFCTVEENTWNYIEFQADNHQREYATRIWLQDTYMGRFEATTTPAPGSRVPNNPIFFDKFIIGKIAAQSLLSWFFSSASVEIEFRDVAMTRGKHDRPLGPTIVIPMEIDDTGTHQIEDPDDVTITADQISFNEDFSLGTDGAGQPRYWTGYDRGDNAGTGHDRPAGAMYLAYLFGSVFYDSFVSLVSDGSGPPGHTGEDALKIETSEDGGPVGAAYVFGGATEPAIDLLYDVDYSDTVGVEMWIKGVAGHSVNIRTASGIGGWPAFNSHTMDGTWEKIRLFAVPVATSDSIMAIILEFPDAGVGDSYLIKQFKAYINMDAQPGLFFETADGGTTTTVIPPTDSTTHTLIDDFPATGSDQVYLSTSSLRNTLRGDEDDNHTYLAPAWSDDYLEYIMDQYNPDDGQKVLGAKLLLHVSGYAGINPTISPPETSPDFTTPISGRTHVVISDGDGRRYTGEFVSGIHASDDEDTLYGVNLPLPPDQGEWTITKWNEFLVRFGFHDTVFQNSQLIIADFSDGGVVRGVAGELLTYDRRLAPPACVRPIDLSRIRFRAYETPAEGEED